MPRLTDQQYLERHRLLKRVWFDRPSAYSTLSTNQQWDIHAYYAPSLDLLDDELLEHRRQVAKEQPSLPQRASKAFLVLGGSRAPSVTSTTSVSGGNKGTLRVRGLARPEPDIKKLALALVMMAEDSAKEEREAA